MAQIAGIILVVGTYPLSKGASQAKTQAILSIPIEWQLTWKLAWLLDWTQAKTQVVFQAKILANWIATQRRQKEPGGGSVGCGRASVCP